jgi:hypothetical protein
MFEKMLKEISSSDLEKEFSSRAGGGFESEAEKAEIKRRLAYPDMRPQAFDQTMEAWMYRISMWGDIIITSTNPEDNTNNKKIEAREFFKLFGEDKGEEWQLNQLATNKLVFYRKYISYNGKWYKQELGVEIRLKSSLRQALDRAKSKGIFNWFKF